MKYLVIEDGKISNVIIADETFAIAHELKPFYDGAAPGVAYDPPTLDNLQAKLKEANKDTAALTEALANLMYEVDKKSIGG